jgi:hypothetical protein
MTFPTRSQPPLFATIPPFEGLLIAQSSKVRSADPTPPPQYQGNDPLVLILGTLLGGGVLGTAFIGFWSKFGNNILISQQSKADLRGQVAKAESDLALSEEKAKLDQTKELFNLILDTLKEERKTTKGILDILLTKYLSSTTEVADNAITQQELLRNLTERLHSQELILEKVSKGVHDIFNRLNMGERENV